MYEEIYDFWMKNIKNWFKPTKEFDLLCSKKFLKYFKIYNNFQDDELLTKKSIVGKIIFLDQLPRNIFRDHPYAYKYDYQAIYFCKKYFNFGDNLTGWDKILFFMPLKHSENIEDQENNVMYWEKQVAMTFDKNLKNLYQRNLMTSLKHYNIIKTFHRFPKRNYILGRISSKKEQKYIDDNKNTFI